MSIKTTMDYRRLILIAALAFVGMLLWEAWEKDFPNQATIQKELRSKEKEAVSIGADDTSYRQTLTPTKQIPASSATESSATQTTPRQIIHVKTNVLDIDIDTEGGNVIRAALPKYPLSLDQTKTPYVLLNSQPATKYVAQSGLIGENGSDSALQNAIYSTEQTRYVLDENQDTLAVHLKWQSPNNISVTKIYTFKRDSYVVDIQYQIQNASSQLWQGFMVSQLSRTDSPPDTSALVRPYFGASYSTPEDPYVKVRFEDMVDMSEKKKAQDRVLMNQMVNGGWVAMQEHYFVSALIPNQKEPSYYYYKIYPEESSGSNRTVAATPTLYAIGIEGANLQVAPNSNLTTATSIYIGPEETNLLKAAAPHLEMTIDYGWFWFISAIIFWIMEHIYSVVGNWGWAIVIVTLFIKVLLYPLSLKMYRSFAKMKQLQPKIAALQERYVDDKQKFTQSVMELYRKEKANPFSSFLPILVQIPIFVALYWVLIENIALRQAPFIFWLKDLSLDDPFYILPILCGVAMFFQQKLNPPPPDPMQAKLMMLFPIVITLLLLKLPSGSVLYMLTNTVVSIAQQWYIMKKLEKEQKNGKSVKKTTKKKSFYSMISSKE